MVENYTKSKTTTHGTLSDFLRKLVLVWKGRQDSEHEQAVIRILVGLAAAAYLFKVLLGQKTTPAALIPTSVTIAGFFLSAAIIIIWLIFDPGINKKRRILGCCIDIGATTIALYLNGNMAAPLFVVYLWVTFGNGFRFGRSYLFFSMSISIAGYCFVIFTSNLWQANAYVSFGLLAGMIMLPLYVASLLKRLTTALSEAEAASKAKSNFLATMSHEIRTPLNGIIGIIDLFKQTQLDMQQQHYTDILSRSSDWLLRVLSDGLDFTKIESDELIIEFLPANLKEVLNNLSDIYSEIVSSRPIRFVYRIDENIPAAVECDKFRLLQVLNNLLVNAFKFTDRGEICLSVSCGKQTAGCIPISFSVSDTGKGIASDDFETIFEPFHQAGLSTSQNYGGTGLGLTIASRIVKLMGGIIEVESTLGKGTSFFFQLNLKIAEQINSLPVPGGGNNINWKRPPLILLVEDNEVNSEVATFFLEHFGCEVFTCANGFLAVEAVHNKKFDLILMDCQMPQMDGYEATRRIRQMPGHSAIPIVALTAHTTVEDRKKCFEAGMLDYMGKPFKGEELELLLSRWLADLIIGYEEKSCKAFLNKETDITQKIAIEENQKKALHDLRNSLGAILGNTELALNYQNDPEAIETRLKSILAAVIRANEISSSLIFK